MKGTVKMNLEQNHKLAIIIDSSLPMGLIANTASVLSLSIGKFIDGIIGEDLTDKRQKKHIGITTIPIPILKSDKQTIKNIRENLYEEEIFVVDFCDAAQTTKNYADYKIKLQESDNLEYLGIALMGNKKVINKFTGSMPLLR